MGKVQLIYANHPSVPLPIVGLNLNKGYVLYLAQGVITMAGDFPCLHLSSSLIMKGSRGYLSGAHCLNVKF